MGLTPTTEQRAIGASAVFVTQDKAGSKVCSQNVGLEWPSGRAVDRCISAILL